MVDIVYVEAESLFLAQLGTNYASEKIFVEKRLDIF